MAPFLYRAHFNRRPSEHSFFGGLWGLFFWALFFWALFFGLFFGALFYTGTIYRARIIRIGIQIGIQMPQAP